MTKDKKSKDFEDKLNLIDKVEIENRLENKEYLARAIIEVVGKPKEHIEETIREFIIKISNDERYGMISQSIEKAEEVENNEESFFSTFAEIEFIAKSEIQLMNFVIEYMPASIEVIEPASMNIQANFISHLLTELVGKLHLIDMEFKKVKAKNTLMSQSLGIMIQNSILILLNLGPRTPENISKVVGVEVDQISAFLEKLLEGKKVIFDESNNSYSLSKKK